VDGIGSVFAKRVVVRGACSAGLSAPKGRRMGHAGAIISAFGEVVADTLARTKKAA